MYGGRVIDDFDRRIVRVYMDEYMGDFLFDTFQPFHFYRDDNVDYKIPAFAETREDFIGKLHRMCTRECQFDSFIVSSTLYHMLVKPPTHV
jgi:hypothetical protein